MPNPSAQRRVNHLVDDIARLYGHVFPSLAATYWKIGFRLEEEASAEEVRAEYGDRIFSAVSEALLKQHSIGFSVENLEKIRAFYRMYPAGFEGLTWNHYCASEHNEILPVEKPVLPPLERPADLRLWTFRKAKDDVAALIAAGWKFAEDPAEEEHPNALVLDCGFFVLRAVAPEEAARVTVTETPAYTYPAIVERVVDGDTLIAEIFTGFGGSVRERLRLRGINTPELKMAEGEEAKEHVTGLLPSGIPVVIKSYKTDDYGRFVADVFYKPGAATPEDILTEGIYLNQQLLDEGIAVRMKE